MTPHGDSGSTLTRGSMKPASRGEARYVRSLKQRRQPSDSCIREGSRAYGIVGVGAGGGARWREKPLVPILYLSDSCVISGEFLCSASHSFYPFCFFTPHALEE